MYRPYITMSRRTLPMSPAVHYVILARLTDFNHIHSRDGDDWVCGRSMALQDDQILQCEGRDPDEEEACRLCAERIIGFFGDPMHVH
jgi:hypothetical protein